MVIYVMCCVLHHVCLLCNTLLSCHSPFSCWKSLGSKVCKHSWCLSISIALIGKKKKKNNSMNWKLSKNFLLQFHQIMSMLLIVCVEVTHKLKVLQCWNENHTKKRESRSWDCEWFIVLINIKLCPLYSESRVAGNHNRNNKLSI